MTVGSKARSLFALTILLLFGNQVWAQADAQKPDQAASFQTTSQSNDARQTDSAEAPTDGAATDDQAAHEKQNEGENDEENKEKKPPPLLTNDAVIFGILMLILGFVFWSSKSDFKPFKMFYAVIPMLLMCYFLPSLLTLFNVVDAEKSNLYHIATRYMLPASLILLTLSIDLKEIFKLGPKALIMFFTGTVGVILGGPLAILIVSSFAPSWVGGVEPNEVWRGMTTIAGSWIGGGANQVAMKEVFDVSKDIYPAMVAIDVLVAEFWMMFLLLGVGKADAIDRFLKADSSSIERLKEKMEKFQISITRVTTTTDLVILTAIGFGGTALSHFAADTLAPMFDTLGHTNENFAWVLNFSLHKPFFWLVVTATTVGVGLSFTSFRNYEGAGASKMGTLFIFILVAVIGMGMDLMAVVKYTELFVVGLIWMIFHVGLLFLVAWMIRAPYFFLAVGSKANIGGAASAPVVAAAFHPALAPVGVLLAVLGYALGTYGAMICGWLMKSVAPVGGG